MKMRLPFLVAATFLFAGCSEKPQPLSGPPFVLKALHPSEATAGAGFNVQPNGKSAIAVECENATKDTVILFDNHPLPTVFGSSSLLTAEVPPEYYAQPGAIAVSIKSPRGQSASLPLTIK